jgi:putative zinc finger protein
MDQISKLIRRRMQAAPDQETNHPDPDLLAAFAEKALAKTDRVQVLEHLAQCSDCRDIVSLATPEFETTAAVTVTSSSGWLSGSVLRWGALAASVAVVIVAVTLPRLSHHASLSPAPQSAVQTDAKGNAPEARMEKPEDKIAASISPSSDKTREAAFADKLPNRAGFSRQGNSERVPRSTRSSEADNSRQAVAQSALPASPLFAKSVDESELARKPELAEREEHRRDLKVNANNELVTLQAKAAPAELEMTPGKAKAAPSKVRASQAESVNNGVGTLTVAGASSAKLADAISIKSDDLRRREKLPRWTLSSDGTLQRSFDAGKTWTKIPFPGSSVFRALATVGADVWVGGSAGSLYRSADAGEHWLKVIPTVGGKVLSADIIGVEFTDSNHGKLTTANEQIWITADAGQTWQTN